MKKLVTGALGRNFFGINDDQSVEFEMALDEGHKTPTDGTVPNDTNGSINLMIHFPLAAFLH